MPLLALNLNKRNDENKVQIILIILCFILFYSVNTTYVFRDEGKAKFEITLTVKLSPEIQDFYRLYKDFFIITRKMLLNISNFINKF